MGFFLVIDKESFFHKNFKDFGKIEMIRGFPDVPLNHLNACISLKGTRFYFIPCVVFNKTKWRKGGRGRGAGGAGGGGYYQNKVSCCPESHGIMVMVEYIPLVQF